MVKESLSDNVCWGDYVHFADEMKSGHKEKPQPHMLRGGAFIAKWFCCTLLIPRHDLLWYAFFDIWVHELNIRNGHKMCE